MMADDPVQCSMRLALQNVIRFGDTDILPFPIERQVMKDKPEETLGILLDIHKNFKEYIERMPLESDRLLQSVGYTGFRIGTFIDPIWNVYLLGLVILIGENIESE